MEIFLSVIIPAYNEEKIIINTLRTVRDYLTLQDYSWEVIVVDDGSLDQTVPLVKKFAQENEGFSLIKSTHKGKAVAVRKGILAGRGNYILFSDADLSTPIEEVRRLLVWLEDHSFQVAIASREGVGARRQGEPWYRHLMGRVFNKLVKSLVVSKFEDTQCGFKVFTRQAARDIFSRLRLYTEDSPQLFSPRVSAFDVEVLFLASRLGYKVKEVPVSWKYIPTSRVRVWDDSLVMLLEVLKIKWWSWRGKYN